ncbi:MAG: right-handed parallel beta-helix repeat-containing protein [Verrucomicrobia bacterium]|nr:right-handed parallel beta-helix repeat-containing protein [Verrucomicrobiota bacterium]
MNHAFSTTRTLWFLAALTLICGFSFAQQPARPPAAYDVRDFGAVGDGKTDDTKAIHAAIAAALCPTGVHKRVIAFKGNKDYPGMAPITVFIPRGTYLVSQPIHIQMGSYSWNSALVIQGEYARLRASQPMKSVMHVNIAAHVLISGLTLDANKQAQHGFTAFKISGRPNAIQRVNAENALSHGFVLEKCQGGNFRDCSATRNDGDGWQIVDCNAGAYDDCVAMHNKGNGFTIASKDFSAGCCVSSFWSEANGGHGVFISPKVASTVVLRDAWIEGNKLDGVNIGSTGAHLTALNILGNFREGDPGQTGRSACASIRLTSTAAGCYVSGCLVRGGGAKGGNIRCEGDPTKHHVAGNFRGWAARNMDPVTVDVVKPEPTRPAAPPPTRE